MISYYFKRIINDKTKLFMIIFILILPIAEILLYLRNISVGGYVPYADLACFLTGNSHGLRHMIQSVFLWFMPFYLLVVVADDCIEDYQSGYKNVMISKMGNKRYFINNIIKGFVFSFVIVFTALIFNFILVHILFYSASGQNISAILGEQSGFLKWSAENVTLTNIIYIVIASLIYAITGATGTAVSVFFHERKIIYPLMLALWFVPLLLKKSIMIFLQPFSEYSITYALPTVIIYIIVNIALVISLYLVRIKNEKI